jgi:uncharacterized membrane protein
MSKKTSSAGEIIAKVGMFGVAGWVAENALCGDRYSSLFRGHKVPFLPIYAAGGLAVTAAAPYVDHWPTLARAFSYAILGTAVEYAGCQLDRKLLNSRSWDYGGRDALARSSEGCVNFAHSALWGGLGLVAEKFK